MKKFLLFIVFSILSVNTTLSDSTNALNGLDYKSGGLGWIAPLVLDGEPELTGYQLHWNDENVKTNAVIYKSFHVTNAIPYDTRSTGQEEFLVQTNEQEEIEYEYHWGEGYFTEIQTNELVKFWFWVTASNETGAVSEFSEHVTISVETYRPSAPKAPLH